jgi:hypothetical protein
MNKQEEFKEDLLRYYINPGKIEKAPEGFTLKVMGRIQMEEQLSAVSERSPKINLIPVIFIAVTLMLLAAALLIPGNESDKVALPLMNLLKNIKSSLPEFSLSSLFKLTLPSVMMYVCLGILVLTLFDRALYGIFHKEK